MADDISIFVKVVGQKEIVSTTNSLNKLETGVKRLSKDLSKGRIDSAQYTTGLKELRRGVDSSFSSWQKAKAAVDQYSKELKEATAEQARAQAAIKAETAALKQYRQARRDATAENARYDAEQRKAAKTARDTATANRRLRMEFKEGYAAQVQLRAAQMRLNQAMRKGVIDTDQYETQLQQLKIAQQSMGAAAQVGGRRVNSSGMLIQQAGYQFGDFAVQVQGGTNWMVAFGQQATQMIGAFNMLPQATLAASVGIGALRISVVALIASLGVIIPVLTAVGAYFMRKAAAARDSAEATKTVTQAVQDYTGASEAFHTSLEETVEKYGSAATAARDFLRAEMDIADFRAGLKVQESIASLIGRELGDETALLSQFQSLEAITDEILRLQDAFESTADTGLALELENQIEALGKLGNSVKDVASELSISGDEAVRLVAQFAKLEEAQGPAQQSAAAQDLLKTLTDVFGKYEDMNDAARELYDQTVELGKATSEMVGTMENPARTALTALRDLAKSLWDNMKGVADESNRFADNLVLGQGYLDAAVRSGVASGAIPPEALQDLPRYSTAMTDVIEGEREEARKPEGNGSAGTTGRGTAQKTPAELAAEAVAKLQAQLNLQRELIGMTEE